jgi:hypothetical protein
MLALWCVNCNILVASETLALWYVNLCLVVLESPTGILIIRLDNE